ncbi:hypothetical protein E2C01_100634 [Portunus trituberculatus]|uniref:Uncharacterized protein n=1 Tax=Portunus trituberculatus TaxID=210409 RepID=A0A5B7K7F1_PORTR|nr:hypothetical protein [Portunus trituberculatus]
MVTCHGTEGVKVSPSLPHNAPETLKAPPASRIPFLILTQARPLHTPRPSLPPPKPLPSISSATSTAFTPSTLHDSCHIPYSSLFLSLSSSSPLSLYLSLYLSAAFIPHFSPPSPFFSPCLLFSPTPKAFLPPSFSH